jgi:hypothetical protein
MQRRSSLDDPPRGQEVVIWRIPAYTPSCSLSPPSSLFLFRMLVRPLCRLLLPPPSRTMRILRTLSTRKAGDHFTALCLVGNDLAFAVSVGSASRRARLDALNLSSSRFCHSYVLDEWWWLDRLDVGRSASHLVSSGS